MSIIESDLVPEEILIHIFSFLRIEDVLLSLATVNTTFYNCSMHDALWKGYFKQYSTLYQILKEREPNIGTSYYQFFKTQYILYYRGWYKFRGYKLNYDVTKHEESHRISMEKVKLENDFFENYKETIQSHKLSLENDEYKDLGYNYLIFQNLEKDKLRLMTCSQIVNFYDVELDRSSGMKPIVKDVKPKYGWKDVAQARCFLWTIEYQPHRMPNTIFTGGNSTKIFCGTYIPDDEVNELIKSTSTVDSGQVNGIWSLRILNKKHIVTAGTEGFAKIFDVEKQQEVISCSVLDSLHAHKSTVYDVDCNPSGEESSLFVTGSVDQLVKVFDTRSRKPIGEVFTGSYIYEVNAQHLDPSKNDYMFLAGSDRGVIHLMDIRKLTTGLPSYEKNYCDPSILHTIDVFRLGAIRGLLYDRKKIVIGSKIGVCVLTTDEHAHELSKEMGGTKHINEFVKKEVFSDYTSECPWKVVNYIPIVAAMSLEMNEEVLVAGSSSNDVYIGTYPILNRPFNKQHLIENRQSTKNCNIQ
ncbi:hypothetical protein ABK040_010863 [Willaertia magna]